MHKKVIIISSTPRKNGNSQILSEAFAKGAIENNNEVELISLRENKINYCIGCYGWRKTGKCVQNDGMNEIIEKMLNSDVVVFSSPIYMYDISGQLKAFMDRLLPHYADFKDIDLYYIATCAENNTKAIESSVVTIKGFLECAKGINLKDVIYGIDLHAAGESANSRFYNHAYELGKNI